MTIATKMVSKMMTARMMMMGPIETFNAARDSLAPPSTEGFTPQQCRRRPALMIGRCRSAAHGFADMMSLPQTTPRRQCDASDVRVIISINTSNKIIIIIIIIYGCNDSFAPVPTVELKGVWCHHRLGLRFVTSESGGERMGEERKFSATACRIEL